jgi:hypothetical protein
MLNFMPSIFIKAGGGAYVNSVYLILDGRLLAHCSPSLTLLEPNYSIEGILLRFALEVKRHS